MHKSPLTRSQINIISRHSNWPAHSVKNRLKSDKVYADGAAWASFIDIALISLGAAFCLAGIVFFFAYNWNDLHKFAKLGIIGFLILACTITFIILKQHLLVKKLLLTAASILVGVFFAVFGQIYQTGADTYDLFLGWTVFTLLWALASRFEPLWLIWLLLANTTFVFYVDQAGPGWAAVTICLIMAAFNTAVVLLLYLLYHFGKITQPAQWFMKTLGLTVAGCITVSIVTGIFDHYPRVMVLSALFAALVYTTAVYYSYREKSLFYLCVIPLSVIIIITMMIADHIKFNDSSLFIIITMFIVTSITLVVKQLTYLNKKWHGNN